MAEAAEHDFEPYIGQRSQQIAHEARETFTDRTLQHYVNRVKRQDRDPVDIEFERQREECTFQP